MSDVDETEIQRPPLSDDSGPQSPQTESSIPLKESARPRSTQSASSPRLSAWDFVDYREYLKAFYSSKKSTNPSYSMSAFARKAGFGENSRGYLKLVIEGKRNLTAHTLMRFIEAIGLENREAQYFESLVHFNQAKGTKDRDFYFKRLESILAGRRSTQFELLKSQNQYYSTWYYVAIRELAALDDFLDDPQWIGARLREKVPRAEIQRALADLVNMGMLAPGPNGRLVQSQSLVKSKGLTRTQLMDQFHLEMLERAKESLLNDTWDERDMSSVTISCDHAALPEIKEAIKEFRDLLATRFGLRTAPTDTVFQVSLQVFQLTEPKSRKR